jgi:hypothetical protein
MGHSTVRVLKDRILHINDADYTAGKRRQFNTLQRRKLV